jgi:hypothetical protein
VGSNLKLENNNFDLISLLELAPEMYNVKGDIIS